MKDLKESRREQNRQMGRVTRFGLELSRMTVKISESEAGPRRQLAVGGSWKRGSDGQLLVLPAVCNPRRWQVMHIVGITVESC